MTTPITDEFAHERGSVRGTSYIDVGTGPVTVFLHGIFTNALLWRRCIRELSAERRCVAIDLPGHGRSAPTADASIHGLVDAVRSVLDELGLTEDVHLVAHDTGGAVGQLLYAAGPARFASLAFTNCDTEGNFPPPAFRPFVPLARLGALALLRPVVKLPWLARQGYRVGYRDLDAVPLEIIRSYTEPVLGSRAGAAFMRRLMASMRGDQLAPATAALRDCKLPTAIVWGTGDVLFATRWATWLRDLVPGATDVVEVRGGRLYFVDEYADQVVTALRNHWKQGE